MTGWDSSCVTSLSRFQIPERTGAAGGRAAARWRQHRDHGDCLLPARILVECDWGLCAAWYATIPTVPSVPIPSQRQSIAFQNNSFQGGLFQRLDCLYIMAGKSGRRVSNRTHCFCTRTSVTSSPIPTRFDDWYADMTFCIHRKLIRIWSNRPTVQDLIRLGKLDGECRVCVGITTSFWLIRTRSAHGSSVARYFPSAGLRDACFV